MIGGRGRVLSMAGMASAGGAVLVLAIPPVLRVRLARLIPVLVLMRHARNISGKGQCDRQGLLHAANGGG